MNEDLVKKIQSNPSYVELVKKRSSFAIRLAIIMLTVYYTFIMVVAFSPDILGTPVGDGIMTLGIPVGIAIILFAFGITGYYTNRANTEFDDLLNNLKSELKEDIKNG